MGETHGDVYNELVPHILVHWQKQQFCNRYASRYVKNTCKRCCTGADREMEQYMGTVLAYNGCSLLLLLYYSLSSSPRPQRAVGSNPLTDQVC